jgi:hypothetical protein
MQDRVKAGNGTDTTITFGAIPSNVDTVLELIAYLVGGAPADITASDTAPVSGTPINKASLLKDATATLAGLTPETATPDDVLALLLDPKIQFLASHPIGSIYMTTNADESTPAQMATKYGGTWAAFGAGRVPVGVDTEDKDFNAVGKMGGTKSTGAHIYSGAGICNSDAAGWYLFRHGSGSGSGQTAIYRHTAAGVAANVPITSWNHIPRVYETQTPNDAGVSRVQPYITCYMYKRTA